MIILILSFLTYNQVAQATEYLPAIVKMLDSPDFETREFATNLLIALGEEHQKNPEDMKLRFINFKIEQSLENGYKVLSVEGKDRINRITERIRQKQEDIVDVLRRMYGKSKVAFD